VWLLPTLKETLYRKLFSQSGQCLNICNKELWYVNLHKKYLRATPKLFSLYHMAVSYYETMTEYDHALETPDTRVNTLSDHRNVMLTFIRINKYKVGLNLLSNRLRAISKCIPKNCILQTKNQFKTFCKINLIQKGLLLLWILLKHAIKLCRRSFHSLKIYQYQRGQFRSAINDFLKICIMLCVFVQMISHNKHSNQIKKINIKMIHFP